MLRIHIRILVLLVTDADQYPTFRFDADPDPSFQVKAQNLGKSAQLGSIRIRNQLDGDPDLAYHIDADADSDPELDPTFQFDPDPDPPHCFILRSSQIYFPTSYVLRVL